MPPVGFEPTIPVSERPQTHVLDRAATGIGHVVAYIYEYVNSDDANFKAVSDKSDANKINTQVKIIHKHV
jgi:hypothetical protein